MANPQVPQGSLNRLRVSIVLASYPGLNITPGYLGKEMVSLAFDGVATTPIDTATGVVQSPEPYQRVTMTAHLLRTQALANLWKAQLEALTDVGDFVVRTDAQSLGPYQISNGYIQSVSPLRIDGSDAGWVIMLGGIYYINNLLWNF